MKCSVCDEEGAEQLGDISPDWYARTCPRCGSYYLAPAAEAEIRANWNDRRYLLSAAIRKMSDVGRRAEIMEDDLAQLASSVRPPAGVIDGIDRLMLMLADRAAGYQKPVGIDVHKDYPLIVARNAHELTALETFAHEFGFLKSPGFITVKGWTRIDELRATRPKSHQAFVAMSFASELDDAFEHGLKPGIEASRYYTAFRVDRAQHTGRSTTKSSLRFAQAGLS